MRAKSQPSRGVRPTVTRDEAQIDEPVAWFRSEDAHAECRCASQTGCRSGSPARLIKYKWHTERSQIDDTSWCETPNDGV